MNDLVKIDQLSKTFSPHFPPAIKELTTSLPEGKIIGLVGADGAGKTTLIRLITGLLRPSSGQIQVNGFDTLKNAKELHTLIGYMPQRFGLYEDLTVMQNLRLYADLRGVEAKEQTQVFDKLLHFTGLKEFQARVARALSGGMKQKLGLACALMKKPKLLLLDEPSVGVDPISRRELWKMVQDLLKEGITILWSTAYLDEVERFDSILLLNKGELLFSGSPHTMTDQMEEKVFAVTGTQKKRQILLDVMQQDNVLDGLIQGEKVRVVVKALPFIPPQGTQFERVKPRFEDAFISLLGGGPKGQSRLAQNRHRVEEKGERVVHVEGLTKKFGSFIATDQLSFSVKRGEVFGLLGPNGAGKSTTFKMLCGLLRPTSGKIWINDVPLDEAPSKARALMGYMAQKFSLYSGLTVGQNLDFFSGIYGLVGKEKKEAIEEMVEIFDLKSYLKETTELLPLGFKQRLSLACAIMHKPPLIFLDEPTSGVDPITRREFWNHINGLVEKKVTVLLTTHFMDEAEYCDRLALIYQGKIIHIDTPDALKQDCITKECPSPTLEDAFVKLIEDVDAHTTKTY